MNAIASTDPAEQRIPSGIPGIDTILSGGFMMGGIYIVQGPPGAGKTIFTNQLCFNHVAGGGRATFVTLLAENYARMLNNMRRMAFFDDAVIPDRLVYLSVSADLRDGGLSALLNLMRREIQQRRTSVLVIDGLVSVHTVANSELEFKHFVHDLQEIALATDCTIFLTTNDDRTVSPERTMVDGLLVLTESMRGWHADSHLQVTKFRGSGYLRGRHSYVVDERGITVYPRIEALYDGPGPGGMDVDVRVPSGVARFDSIIGGGLPNGSTTLLAGPSGVGKTTMGLQFLAQCSPAEPGLLFGFYETPKRLRTRAEAIDPALGAMFDDGTIAVQWQSPAGDAIDAYGQRLLDTVRSHGVKRLFIDGLSAFQQGASDPSRVGNFFNALGNELRLLGVTTMFTVEMPDVLGATIRMPSHNASALAENIVVMRFVEYEARLHRVLSILKMRDSDFDPAVFEFVVGDGGVHIDREMAHVRKLLRPFAGGFDGADDRGEG